MVGRVDDSVEVSLVSFYCQELTPGEVLWAWPQW